MNDPKEVGEIIDEFMHVAGGYGDLKKTPHFFVEIGVQLQRQVIQEYYF